MAIRSYQGVKPTVAEQVYVDESAQVIGRVDLGARSSVWIASRSARTRIFKTER